MGDAVTYSIVATGDSRSFPEGDAFLSGANAGADVVVCLGAFHSPGSHQLGDAKTAILLELDTECLGVHTGEQAGEEGSNVVGFARYRNGDDAPSDLIELVRQPNTHPSSVKAARQMDCHGRLPIHCLAASSADVDICV